MSAILVIVMFTYFAISSVLGCRADVQNFKWTNRPTNISGTLKEGRCSQWTEQRLRCLRYAKKRHESTPCSSPHKGRHFTTRFNCILLKLLHLNSLFHFFEASYIFYSSNKILIVGRFSVVPHCPSHGAGLMHFLTALVSSYKTTTNKWQYPHQLRW